MIDSLIEALSGISADVWTFIALGLVGVTFIAIVVTMFVAGDVNKFKKAAKILIMAPDPKTANLSAKKMPVKVTKLYKRVKVTGEKPGDVIGIDACINTPYNMSVASKFWIIVLIVSVFCAIMAAGGAYIYAGALAASAVAFTVVGAAGLLFTVLAAVLGTVFYKGAVKVYDQYITALDSISKDGNFDNVDLGPDEVVVKADKKAATDKPKTDAQVSWAQELDVKVDSAPFIVADGAADGVDFEPLVANAQEQEQQDGDFVQPPLQEEVIEDSQDQSQEQTDSFGSMTYSSTYMFEGDEQETSKPLNSFSRPDSGVRLEDMVVTPPPPPPPPPIMPVRTPPPQSAADVRARVEEARLERQKAAQSAQMSRPASISYGYVPPQANANAGLPASAASILAQIDKVSTEGASLVVMKDIAQKLQAERAKPENKTPEISKKLSEGQVKLIKAMSTAMKK